MPLLEVQPLLFATIASLLIAVLLDVYLGEPRRWHPLVGFGALANYTEFYLNRWRTSHYASLLLGLVAWCLLIASVTTSIVVVTETIKNIIWLPLSIDDWLIDAVLVYLTIGFCSLREHARAVCSALESGSLNAARQAVAMIVSRDTDTMNAVAIRKATIESVLENGNDAVYAPIFWFLIGGIPAVVIYRLSNTLDAMWGYKTQRFLYFGRIAARMDDILNWLPARCVAISYSLLGHTKDALYCWQQQASSLASPNSSIVMTAGAGTLKLELGGQAKYHGKIQHKPVFGRGHPPTEGDIERSVQLIERTLWLWCVVIVLCSLVLNFI